jgi:predicted O-linked N-acetylglucosamine transferase (SPINDLY family)
MQEAIKSFEKAAQINPQFAPAFEGLAQAYSVNPETQKQAVEAGIRAAKLEPTTHAYAINLVHLLLNNNRDTDARQLAQRLLDKATSPQEAQIARDLLERVKEHEQWAAQRKMRLDAAANSTKQSAVANAPTETQTMTAPPTKDPVDTSQLMAVDGLVRAIDCSHKPAITLRLGGGSRPLTFHAADFGGVGVTGAGESTVDLDSCEKWKGRRVRIWFLRAQGKDYLGEITNLAFE